MSDTQTGWDVLPHGPLVQLAENLWWVSGDIPNMSLKRTMTLVRLGAGGLLLHSAIALEASAQAELESFGVPEILVVPNGMHRLDAPAYKRRYPQLRVLGPEGSRKKIEQVIPLDAVTSTFEEDASVRFEALRGVDGAEDAMWVQSRDGLTLVLTDVMFNMDRKRDVLGFLFTTVLGSAPGPRVSRLAKMLLVRDKLALREHFQQLAETPNLIRVIVAHEKVAHGEEAREALRKAATYL